MNDDYGISKIQHTGAIAAPELDYRPRNPRQYNPLIGLIGCGGITAHHLNAYKKAGYHVVAVCDIHRENAEKRRAEYFPDAEVFTDHHALLRRQDIEVVDIATHPEPRAALIEDALRAGKHVLSQKPFVLDLDAGERLATIADEQGRKLAVNQNGRWAPHFSYMRHAIAQGLIGDVTVVNFALNWDHTWIAGTPFEKIHHIVLYDFAIHWFDIALQFLPGRHAKRVYANVTRAAGQTINPPLIAAALAEFDGAVAAFGFNGASTHGQSDRTVITGTKGTLISAGPGLTEQTVRLFTAEGESVAALAGSWFPDGFHGTMAELLSAIEDDREPTHSARNNLHSLALAFAAMASADSGEPQTPGAVRKLQT